MLDDAARAAQTTDAEAKSALEAGEREVTAALREVDNAERDASALRSRLRDVVPNFSLLETENLLPFGAPGARGRRVYLAAKSPQ